MDLTTIGGLKDKRRQLKLSMVGKMEWHLEYHTRKTAMAERKGNNEMWQPAFLHDH